MCVFNRIKMLQKSSYNDFHECQYKCLLWAYFNSTEIFKRVLSYCLFSNPADSLCTKNETFVS